MATDRTAMRDRILQAAATVLRERGVVAATTKEIARTAGVSEGSLYNHFTNKSDLFAGVFAELNGGINARMTELSQRCGTGTVPDNLTDIATAAIEYYTRLLPMTGPVLTDPAVLEWLRQSGRAAGPLGPQALLIGYLQEERAGGRLPSDVDPTAVAAALLGGCQLHAYLTLLAGSDAVQADAGLSPDRQTYARTLVMAVVGRG